MLGTQQRAGMVFVTFDFWCPGSLSTRLHTTGKGAGEACMAWLAAAPHFTRCGRLWSVSQSTASHLSQDELQKTGATLFVHGVVVRQVGPFVRTPGLQHRCVPCCGGKVVMGWPILPARRGRPRCWGLTPPAGCCAHDSIVGAAALRHLHRSAAARYVFMVQRDGLFLLEKG